jgi:hypothetical protein
MRTAMITRHYQFDTALKEQKNLAQNDPGRRITPDAPSSAYGSRSQQTCQIEQQSLQQLGEMLLMVSLSSWCC